MCLQLNEFDILEEVGRGKYGTCRKVRRKNNEEVFLSKKVSINPVDAKTRDRMLAEVRFLRELEHENITKLHEVFIDHVTHHLFMLMEYCSNGDLKNLIDIHKSERLIYFEEQFIWKILHQLSAALSKCHVRGDGRCIIHRDIKPANIMFDSKWNAKLGDFGIAREVREKRFKNIQSLAEPNVKPDLLTARMGTSLYMAPEQWNNHDYDQKVDMWSLGVVTFEVCDLISLYDSQFSQGRLKQERNRGKTRRIPSCYSDDLDDLLSSLIVVEPSARPDAHEIFEKTSRWREISTDVNNNSSH